MGYGFAERGYNGRETRVGCADEKAPIFDGAKRRNHIVLVRRNAPSKPGIVTHIDQELGAEECRFAGRGGSHIFVADERRYFKRVVSTRRSSQRVREY